MGIAGIVRTGDVYIMAKHNGHTENVFKADADSFAKALVQIGELHGQLPGILADIKSVTERMVAAEAWQKRYGNMWWVFSMGCVCGMFTIVEIIMKLFALWPVIAKYVLR